MSYKVYWLFKETDEPFGSRFIYSRGKVGVRSGFSAAISPSPVAAVLFFSSFSSGIWEDVWGPLQEEMEENY